MLKQITCDTGISEILSEEDIAAAVAGVESAANEYVTSVQNMIHQEENAGLSSNAFLINKKPLLNGRANTFLSNIEILSSVDSWKAELSSSLAVQRTKELKKLANEVSNKIQDLSTEYHRLSSAYDSMIDENDKAHLASRMSSCKDSLTKYQKKLKTVKGLI